MKAVTGTEFSKEPVFHKYPAPWSRILYEPTHAQKELQARPQLIKDYARRELDGYPELERIEAVYGRSSEEFVRTVYNH